MKYYLVPNGTEVTTVSALEKRDYTEGAIAVRRPNADGVIIDHSDSHGLCYKVRHEDGVSAFYDPDELTTHGVSLSDYHAIARIMES